jgi:hypothetical protein
MLALLQKGLAPVRLLSHPIIGRAASRCAGKGQLKLQHSGNTSLASNSQRKHIPFPKPLFWI